MRFTAAFVCVVGLHAASPQLPEPYRSIAGMAYSAPPEFAADALLRIVEYGRLADPGQKRDLVEQAFRLAVSARFAVRMIGLPGTTADTRSGSLSKAYGFKLDTLSLQSRAVRDMLVLDPSKGRELFQDIARPVLAVLTCDDALVYEVSDYYQAMGAVANSAFTPKERARGEHLNFVLDAIGQTSSPAQLAALIPVVESASVTPPQREALWAKLNAMFESLRPDGRSFAASLAGLRSVEVPELRGGLEAYAQQGHGCEHDSIPSPSVNATPRPADPDATPKVEHYWQSAEAQQLFQAGQKLRFTPQKDLRSDEDRASAQWQQQLADYLGRLNTWTPGLEKSEADYYHQKCDVYQSLVELVPAGPQQDRLLEDYVAFLSNSNFYQQSPVEWFVGPEALMERVQGDGKQLRNVLAAFLNSGNPVLALEARLRLAIRMNSPQWFVSQR